MNIPHLTLVLGGARSGKSRHAEALIEALPPPWAYIATAQAWDDEMTARIAEHRARRPADWITLDAPLDLPGAIRGLPEGRPVLVDCLTLWLTNLMLSGADWRAEGARLAAAVAAQRSPVVLVTNEVGAGIVPENRLAREFRDAAGWLNQTVAGACDGVVLCVAGHPIKVKPGADPF